VRGVLAIPDPRNEVERLLSLEFSPIRPTSETHSTPFHTHFEHTNLRSPIVRGDVRDSNPEYPHVTFAGEALPSHSPERRRSDENVMSLDIGGSECDFQFGVAGIEDKEAEEGGVELRSVAEGHLEHFKLRPSDVEHEVTRELEEAYSTTTRHLVSQPSFQVRNIISPSVRHLRSIPPSIVTMWADATLRRKGRLSHVVRGKFIFVSRFLLSLTRVNKALGYTHRLP
jgi:hypothetical protein